MKRLKKLLSLLMALIMIVGAVNLPAKEAKAADTDITWEMSVGGDTGTSQAVDNTKRYVVFLTGITTAQLQAIDGKAIPVYVDGVEQTTDRIRCEYIAGDTKCRLMVYYDALEENVNSAANMGTHSIWIKAGTQVGTYTTTNDLMFKISGTSITKLTGFTMKEFDTNGQYYNGGKYLSVWKDASMVSVLDRLVGYTAPIYVDGVKSEITTSSFAKNGTQGRFWIPFDAIESGKTDATVETIGAHLVQIKAGTVVNDCMLTEECNIYIKGKTVTTLAPSTDITLSANEGKAPTDKSGEQEGRYLVVFADDLSSHQKELLSWKKLTVTIDGVEIKPSDGTAGTNYQTTDSAYFNNNYRLCLPYNLFKAGATNRTGIGTHIVQIKQGTAVGGLTIAEDVTLYINDSTIDVFTGDFDINLGENPGNGNNPTTQLYLFNYGAVVGTQVGNYLNGKSAGVYVDGVLKPANYTYDGTNLRITVPFSSVLAGATTTAVGYHIINTDEVSKVGPFTITNTGFVYKVANGTLTRKTRDDLNITLDVEAHGANDNSKWYAFKLSTTSYTSETKTITANATVPVYINGVLKNGAYIQSGSDAARIILPYTAVQAGATTADELADFTFEVKAGSKIGAYTVTNHVTYTIQQYTITDPGSVLEMNFVSGQAKDDARGYVIALDGPTEEQIQALNDQNAIVWIDGTEVTAGAIWVKDADNKLNLAVPYELLEDGKTTAAELGRHTLEIKAGSTAGAYKIASDIKLRLDQTSVKLLSQTEVIAGENDFLLTGTGTDAVVSTVVNQGVDAGSKLTFKVQTNETQNFAVRLLADGDAEKLFYEKSFDNVNEATVEANVEQDLNSYKIEIEYQNENGTPDTTSDKTSSKAVVKELTVHNGNVAVGWDGTITLTKPGFRSRAFYYSDFHVQKDESISFDVEVSGNAPRAVAWVYYLNDSGNWAAAQPFDMGTNRTISVNHTFENVYYKQVAVAVEFRNSSNTAYTEADLKDCKAVITNFRVTKQGDGTTKTQNVHSLKHGGTIQTDGTNAAYKNVHRIRLAESIPAGSRVSFTLDANVQETYQIRVASGNPDNASLGKVYLNPSGTWAGATEYTVESTIESSGSGSWAGLWVEYRFTGASAQATTNSVTLTNLKITPPTQTQEQTITGVYIPMDEDGNVVSGGTMYQNDDYGHKWHLYLYLSEDTVNYDQDTYYHSLKVDVGGKLRHVRAKTVKSTTGKLISFTLEPADFPGEITDNTVVTIFADSATGYTLTSGTADNRGYAYYEKNGSVIELTSDARVYLNELGASMGGFLTKSTSNVTPVLTGGNASEIYLSFPSEIAEGVVLKQASNTSVASISCTTAKSAYTVTLSEAATAGTKVVLRGSYASENGNYRVSFATTQFEYNGSTWSVVEYKEEGSTGIAGDLNGKGGFNSADLVCYKRYLADDTISVNKVDGDLNGSGNIQEKDLELCIKLLLGTVIFENGSNVTPVDPVYAEKDADNQDIEIAIGAYAGPRRVGPTYYDGTAQNHGTTDYRTEAEFKKYADAGMNFVLSYGDAEYGVNWTSAGSSVATSFAGSDLEKYMQAAAAQDVDVIVSSNTLNGYLKSTTLNNAYQSLVTNMMNDLKRFDNFKGILMADEPRAEYLSTYQVIASAIRAVAENQGVEDLQLYTSLKPGYYDESDAEFYNKPEEYQNYLTNYGDALGFVNYDYYPFNKTQTRGWPFYTYGNDMRSGWIDNLDAAATAAHGKYDSGVTIQSMAHEPKAASSGAWRYRAVDEYDISFQAYAALAYGNKTLTYYTYWSPIEQGEAEIYSQSMVDYPSDGSGESVPTQLYYDVQMVNKKLKAFDHVLMDYQWQGTLALGGLVQPSDYTSKRIETCDADQNAIIGCLKDSNGYDGFMLVNALDPDGAKENADTAASKQNTVSVKFKNADKVIVYRDGVKSEETLTNGAYSITLKAGEGVFVIPCKTK